MDEQSVEVRVLSGRMHYLKLVSMLLNIFLLLLSDSIPPFLESVFSGLHS